MDMPSDADILEEDEAEINITPLVDVCLVLVLIFIVTAPLFSKTLMAVTLPQAVTAQTESQENITISMSVEDGYAINEIPIQRQALNNELRRHIKKAHLKYVLIRADERISHGEVEDLLKLSKRLGARRIAFATVPKG